MHPLINAFNVEMELRGIEARIIEVFEGMSNFEIFLDKEEMFNEELKCELELVADGAKEKIDSNTIKVFVFEFRNY